MREWTREERYQRLEGLPALEYQKMIEQVSQSPFRQTFHIQPKSGLLNDPNGFSYFNGRYHLFYQWFPLGPVHGVKYWYHLSSENMIDWRDDGIAMAPDTLYDSHGVFSGSGIVHDDELYLFYTGNTRDSNWVRHPYQCLARMTRDGEITKTAVPVISQVPLGYTDNFRDPKVFPWKGQYVCLIGSETIDHSGKVVYYLSKDLHQWTFKGEIGTADYENAGFMWECPDYFESHDKGVLLFSPQGMQPQGTNYQNVFQSGYLLGDPIDFETGVFHHEPFKELDRGFEFYAPQTMLSPDGRRLMVAWLGLPELGCVTDEDGWAHCLTLIRELEVKDGQLYQRPLRELAQLRKEAVSIERILDNDSVKLSAPRSYELSCHFSDMEGDYFGLRFRQGDQNETLFYYDRVSNELVFNRQASGIMFAEDYGQERRCPLVADDLDIRLFLDDSSVEIFINDGQEVFTARLFTAKEHNGLEFFASGKACLNATLWRL